MAKPLPSIKTIIEVVSEHTGVPVETILNPQMRTAPIARSRHFVAYLACKGTFRTLDLVGKELKFTSATPGVPVRYGLRKLEAATRRNKKLRTELKELADKLGITIR